MWGCRRKKKMNRVCHRSVHNRLVNFQCNKGRWSWTIYEGYKGQTPLFNAKWLRGRSGHKLHHGVDALLAEIVGVREGNNYSHSVFSILTSVRDDAVLRTFAMLWLPLASATVDRQGCIVCCGHSMPSRLADNWLWWFVKLLLFAWRGDCTELVMCFGDVSCGFALF